MKVLFLLPPSEGKNPEGNLGKEKLSFNFEKPRDIAIHVTEKDLKCTGNRYQEWVELNTDLCNLEGERNVADAISRYTGVMFNAIDYQGMTSEGKKYFEEKYLIFSGMYGIVKPLDQIGNYKLPIETKGLAKYWQADITDALNSANADYIVNLLPLSYQKMIDFKHLKPWVININFLTEKNGKIVKVSHWVKKIKGEWIKNLCEQIAKNKDQNIFEVFWWEKIETDKTIEINILKD